METKLAKIDPIKFMSPVNTEYSQALASNKSWKARAIDDSMGAPLPVISFISLLSGGMFMLMGSMLLIVAKSGWMLGIFSGIALLGLGGMHFNSRRIKERNNRICADLNERFFFQLASGVEVFNRRVTAWNGMLAALELGAEDRMSQEEKENTHQMLTLARKELARKVQLAEGLMLPSRDMRPQVAAYLEELRDAEQELPGRIVVPIEALNQNNFQEVLENEVALFDYVGELKALPPKES